MMDTTILEAKLDYFKAEMLKKMIAVAYKHAGNSVVDNDFPWNEYSIEKCEQHLIEEFGEWIVAKGELHPAFFPSERAKEELDVANMAFICYMLREARK